jgi:alkylation response protein AidB-like acyl-CoA dehydrogenase
MNDVGNILAETADHVLGAPKADWDGVVEAGLHRLLLSEEQGGIGESFPDAVAVAFRVGAHASSLPLLDTMVANWRNAKAGRAISDQAAPVSAANAPVDPMLALLKAAAIAGALDTMLAMSIEYANTRVQFGRALGKFQAVQHMLAQMSAEVVAVTAAVEHAARVALTPEGPWAIAIAKSIAGEAAGTVAAFAHQVHGAIGFTEEFALQRYSRAVWKWREEAGDESYWYDALGAAALKGGESTLWPAVVDGAAN